MSRKELLDLVDEQDRVVGAEMRGVVHREGLLHREVHVWIFNNRGEVLFQKRRDDAETYPSMLDAAVGGHVGAGQEYVDAAVVELREETGLVATAEELMPIEKIQTRFVDEERGLINNAFKMEYALRFDGRAEDLHSEEGIAFQWWSASALRNLPEGEKSKFIEGIFESPTKEVLLKVIEYSEAT